MRQPAPALNWSMLDWTEPFQAMRLHLTEVLVIMLLLQLVALAHLRLAQQLNYTLKRLAAQ